MKLQSIFFKKNDNNHVEKRSRSWFNKFFEVKNYKPKEKSAFYRFLIYFSHYLLAFILSSFALYITAHFNPYLGANKPFLLLFIPIIVAAWVGGGGPALFATLYCAIGVLYYILPPFNVPWVADESASIAVAIFVIEGVIVSGLLETRRRSNVALKARIRQQALLAQLAQYALTSTTISSFFTKVSELITETLNVKYCKILELLPGKKSFILREGTGWRAGLIGHSIVTAGVNSQGGYTLVSDTPVIVSDLKKEKRFYSPELLTSHGIVSGISVIIPGKKGPYGVLGVYSEKKRKFTKDDIYFVQAVANIIATAVDKKTSEKDLRESDIRFKKLFEANIIGVFIGTLDGIMLDGNDAFLSLIEYSREELREGKIHRDTLTPPELSYLTDKSVRDLKTKGESEIFEKEYIAKSGKRVPVLIGVSRIDSKSDTCIGFVLDISKQKELERRKDEFISMASHELKTPITSLKILTQFLHQKFEASKQKEAVSYLEKISKQVNKLTQLVNDLLDATQIKAGKLKLKKTLFNLDELVKEVVDEIQSVTTTHTIVIRSAVKLAVLADFERISQVITNLLTNAIKYSPKNTEIWVKVSEKDNYAVVGVQDFGHGIDKEYQETVFQQFFRVNESKSTTYPGLGMGLYISKEIVEKHQGKIWVESKKKKGSTFHFMIPLPE